MIAGIREGVSGHGQAAGISILRADLSTVVFLSCFIACVLASNAD